MRTSPTLDPITLEVFNHRLASIAEEMGVVLCRSAFSPNIKERRDFSCAIFDPEGLLVAHAAHIPVHLGSAQASVQAALQRFQLRVGDVVLLNDPYAGGTHLPDVTVVSAVFLGSRRLGYVADRAHHSDIGGMSPGSMPMSREIFQEGFRIPPVRLVRGGVIEEDILSLFLANTRVNDDRRGDLLAQLAALRIGERRLQELARQCGRTQLERAMVGLQDYGERLMRAVLRRIPKGIFRGSDALDDDGSGSGPIEIRVAIHIRGDHCLVDFSGTAAQAVGGINANLAVTAAAVYYVFQAVAAQEIPTNSGFMRPIQIIAPEGSVVNCRFPAAVAGGNVETSQRIVDVMLQALANAIPDRIPASSCGSMNNIAFGGYDPVRQRAFSHYETVGGGAGAGPRVRGESAVHTHMTNTMNTPIEALETELPVRIHQYAVRRRSGGSGQMTGGDGIVREMEFLVDTEVSLLTDRRLIQPPGLRGGEPGKTGRNETITGNSRRILPGKSIIPFRGGERLRVLTPGGGGWGTRRRLGTSAAAAIRRGGGRS